MTNLYYYKLTSDNNGAPCLGDGGSLLSLAICKPMIRGKAKLCDLIFGFAASSLHEDNRLIYIARITAKESDGNYFKKAKYSNRGDCIYEWKEGRFSRRKNALHHEDPVNLVHDIGTHPDYSRANVLLSNDFRYFGKAGSDDYKKRFPAIRNVIDNLGRGHRVNHSEDLRCQLFGLKDEVWKNNLNEVVGKPTNDVRRGICHRSRSCGIA